MQTGEVEAKVLRGVGLKDSLRRACCVARILEGPGETSPGPFFLFGAGFCNKRRSVDGEMSSRDEQIFQQPVLARQGSGRMETVVYVFQPLCSEPALIAKRGSLVLRGERVASVGSGVKSFAKSDPRRAAFFIYILGSQSGRVRQTYVGWTTDIDRRLGRHNKGIGAKSTRGRQWTILYAERHASRHEAMSREWHLKRDRAFRKSLWPD